MMRFQRAKQTDLPQLRALWKQAFRDSEQELDDFFRIAYPACELFIARDDGQIAGMACAMPQSVCCGEACVSAAYLYAVATDEQYRNQGVCRGLIAHVEKELKKKYVSCVLLVPENAQLAGMYEKLGYHGRERGSRAVSAPPAAGRAERMDTVAYAGLRETLLWDEPHVRYAKVWLDYEACEAEFHALRMGAGAGCAAAARLPDGTVRVDELLPDERFLPALVKAMPAERYVLPERSGAMVKWLDSGPSWTEIRVGFDFG